MRGEEATLERNLHMHTNISLFLPLSLSHLEEQRWGGMEGGRCMFRGPRDMRENSMEGESKDRTRRGEKKG